MDQPLLSTLEIITVIISDLSGKPESSITADSNLVTDLGLDSLELTQMAMTIESAFGLPPIDYDPKKMETVRDVTVFVEEQMRIKRAEANEHTTPAC